MSIKKQLYLSFGIILSMVLVLLAVNLVAVRREHEAKAAAQRSIDMTEVTSTVRFQMMQNRLHLQNYLLSGDTRDVEQMNDGEHLLTTRCAMRRNSANSEQQRTASNKVQVLNRDGANEFASPLVEKRKDVDSGNATVAEFQIFYLQKDADLLGYASSDVSGRSRSRKSQDFSRSAASPTISWRRPQRS